MEKEIEELQTYLKNVVNFTLPEFKELPSIDLYMEQVLTYVNNCLKTLSPQDEKMLTSFMVNNYVKAKMIAEPKKKKYGREQIGYLLAITLCKATVSMSNMSLLLDLDEGVSKNKERLYEFWSKMEMNLLSDVASKASRHVEDVSKRYQKQKEVNEKKASDDARDALAFLALRLAIQAEVNKVLSDYIISTLRRNMQGEDIAQKIAEKHAPQNRHEKRAEKKEARKVASAKIKAA